MERRRDLLKIEMLTFKLSNLLLSYKQKHEDAANGTLGKNFNAGDSFHSKNQLTIEFKICSSKCSLPFYFLEIFFLHSRECKMVITNYKVHPLGNK